MQSEGSRIGGYLLGECIGQGGMARVYRAEHEALQRQVALKVLLDSPNGSTDGHERFLREARIAAAIKHPNVVNIFDVGVDRGTPYLVMELLEGVDLDAFMAGKPRLEEATTMDIIVPIAGALAAVHEAGIVHRDLKPGNIFLARGQKEEVEPRLLDFGISKSQGDQLKLTSAEGPVLGTPFYMSPEAAQGLEMTPQSDQYALGVVLYECVTGKNPFAPSNNFAEVVRRVCVGDYKPALVQNPQLSRRMAAIIERAMQIDPARRFPDMRAMGRELLMLAGQRTRVTWGLSFNNLPGSGALAASSMLDEPLPLSVPRRPRRARYMVAPLLGMLSILGAYALDELPGVAANQGSLGAPRNPPASPPVTLALKPGPAAEPVGLSSLTAPMLATAAAAELPASGAPATTPPAPASAVAPDPAPRIDPARKAVKAPRKVTPARATPPPPKSFGTNGAPILD